MTPERLEELREYANTGIYVRPKQEALLDLVNEIDRLKKENDFLKAAFLDMELAREDLEKKLKNIYLLARY